MTRRGHTHTERKLEEKKKQRIKFETYVCFGNHFNYKPKISFDIKSFAPPSLLQCFFWGECFDVLWRLYVFSLLCHTHRLQFPTEYTIGRQSFSFHSETGRKFFTHSVCMSAGPTLFSSSDHSYTHTPNILSLNVNYRWLEKEKKEN